MVLVRSRRSFLQYNTLWFPTRAQLEHRLHRLAWNEIVSVKQSNSKPLPSSYLVSYKPFTTMCIDLCRSTDALWSDVRKSTRKTIRRVERQAEDIRIAHNEPKADMDFLEVYNSFVRLSGHAKPMSRVRFEELREFTDRFVVYYAGQPVVAHILLNDSKSGRVRGLYLASRRLEDPGQGRLYADLSRYLRWYEIEYYKQLGARSYDLGGIRLDGSQAAFKQSFGGDVVVEYDHMYAGAVAKPIVKARSTLGGLASRFGSKDS